MVDDDRSFVEEWYDKGTGGKIGELVMALIIGLFLVLVAIRFVIEAFGMGLVAGVASIVILIVLLNAFRERMTEAEREIDRVETRGEGVQTWDDER